MQEGMLLIVVVGSVKRRRGRSTGERVVHRYTSLSSTWTTFAWSGSGIQVAGGSFDLSTGCPAGYVSFLFTFFCLFSPKEFRQRRGRFHRGGGVLPSWLQFSSRYSFCCLRENGRINKWHLARGRRKRGGEARGMKRERRRLLLPFPSLPFLFFSFRRRAGPTRWSSYSSIRRAPLCCAGAAFCQPGEERNTLSLVKRNTMGLADQTVSSKSERETREFWQSLCGWMIGWILLWGVEEGVGRSFVIISDVLSSDIRIVLILSLAD